MNFLESLAAEWYEYTGHFVRTNVRTGKRAAGGWDGELDVLAYEPKSKTLKHVELSSDALSWEKRKERFITKKFVLNDAEYAEVFGLPFEKVERIVVVGIAQEAKFDLNWSRGIEVVLIPQFIQRVAASLKGVDPMSKAVPEGFGLLRAVQFTLAYSTPPQPKAKRPAVIPQNADEPSVSDDSSTDQVESDESQGQESP
jgi:hypothetical protein